MILTKIVEIENTLFKYNLYIKRGALTNKPHDKNLKIFNVDIKYIGLYTCIDIEFICDYCGVVFIDKYNNRNSKHRTSPIKKDSCGSKECSLAKYKESCVKRYGAEFPLNSKGTEPNKKYKETMLEKYGYEFNCRRPEVVEKAMKNYLDNFNEVLEKREKTCLEKFGTKHAFQNEEVKDKIKITNNIRYGGDNSMHSEEIFLKNRKKRLDIFNYKDTKLTYQGTYELDFIEYCMLNNIKIENGQRIPYVFEGKNKKYYSDFYLPNYNLIVEIKSTYTYNMEVLQNLAKCNTCLSNGYKFLFIFDKKCHFWMN